MRIVVTSLIITGLFFSSCGLLNKDDGEDALARVYDKYLYKKDLEDLLLKLEGDKDSSTIITNYIENWVQQELLLEKAELNLKEEEKDFKKLLEDYRRSLIIFTFQKEWVRQNLDTNVSDEEIVEYYDKNQANFELKENILKMRFAKVAKNAPKLNQLEKSIQGSDTEAKSDFKEYCIQYALDYNENDSMWVSLDDLKMMVPIKIDDEEAFLKNNKFVVTADTVNYYLLYINDYKIKSSISPLSFEEERIRNIIINQRKLALISNMKSDLYKTALVKGNAEILKP